MNEYQVTMVPPEGEPQTYVDDGIELDHMRHITLLAADKKAAQARCEQQAFDIAVSEAREALAAKHDDEDLHDLRGDFSQRYKVQGTTGMLYYVLEDPSGELIPVPAEPDAYLEVTGKQPYTVKKVEEVT